MAVLGRPWQALIAHGVVLKVAGAILERSLGSGRLLGPSFLLVGGLGMGLGRSWGRSWNDLGTVLARLGNLGAS